MILVKRSLAWVKTPASLTYREPVRLMTYPWLFHKKRARGFVFQGKQIKV
jgi:hypothetical protein